MIDIRRITYVILVNITVLAASTLNFCQCLSKWCSIATFCWLSWILTHLCLLCILCLKLNGLSNHSLTYILFYYDLRANSHWFVHLWASSISTGSSPRPPHATGLLSWRSMRWRDLIRMLFLYCFFHKLRRYRLRSHAEGEVLRLEEIVFS